MRRHLVGLSLPLLIFVEFVSQTPAQIIISPYTRPDTLGALPAVGASVGGFLPFQGKGELQKLYDSDLFNPTRSVSYSVIYRDSLNAPTSYAEVLSFIPDNSLLRASLAIQLTKAEIEDSTISKRDVALQRFLNGGGNLVITFGKPLYYNEFYTGNFFISGVAISPFLDVPVLNQPIYNPGVGIQLSADFDFRVLTNESNRQPGNIFRLGVRGRGAWNFVNEKYEIKNAVDKDFRKVAFAALQPYLGLAFFEIQYTRNFSKSALFDDREQTLEITVVPVKF